MPLYAVAEAPWELEGANGPLHVEHHGYAWMICDRPGRNVAHVPGEGAVLMLSEEDATAVLSRLSGERD